MRTCPLGDHRFTVRLAPKAAAGSDAQFPPLPEFPLEVRARVRHDVYVMPERVSFGAMRSGESAETTVSLCSSSGREFEVLGLRVPPESFLIVEPIGKRASMKVFRVSQRAAKVGSQSNEVRFVLNRQSVEVALPVIYHGIEVEKWAHGGVAPR